MRGGHDERLEQAPRIIDEQRCGRTIACIRRREISIMRPRSSGGSGRSGKLTQDHTHVARSPSGEAAAARRA